MKKINILLFLLLALGMTLTACNDNDPFSTITPDDDPRIISPSFPDRVDGQLPVVKEIRRDKNLSMTITATPTDYIHIQWLIDGEEVCTERTIDLPLQAGDYHLKILVTTQMGKSTSREGIIRITPLETDPQTRRIGMEYIVSPGLKARIYGKNLNGVTAIKIGDTASSPATFVEAGAESHVEYTIPSDLSEGQHRISFEDAEQNAYGGGMILVTTEVLVTSGAAHATPSQPCTLKGLNLDRISSLTIGDKTISQFSAQTPYELSFPCPALPEGSYTISGSTLEGKEVKFLDGEEFASSQRIDLQKAALWSGHHYVSWEYADGNPNKVFNLIPFDVITSLAPGTRLAIDYSIEPTAAYHKMQTTTGHWNDLPGTQAIEFSENGRHVITLTQEALDLMKQQDGFLCVGHGYYVDQVIVQ